MIKNIELAVPNLNTSENTPNTPPPLPAPKERSWWSRVSSSTNFQSVPETNAVDVYARTRLAAEATSIHMLEQGEKLGKLISGVSGKNADMILDQIRSLPHLWENDPTLNENDKKLLKNFARGLNFAIHFVEQT